MAGIYECTLKGQVIDFIQERHVTSSIIREAPMVRLRSHYNVQCQDVQINLICCVQFPYKASWSQDETILPSSTYKTNSNIALFIN